MSLPYRSRRRANTAAPNRAISGSWVVWSPSTWLASVGVKAARRRIARLTRRRIARSWRLVATACDTGTSGLSTASTTACSLRSRTAPSARAVRWRNMPSNAPGISSLRRARSSLRRSSPCCSPIRLSGTTRRGPTSSWEPTARSASRISLSPPRPCVCISTASTIVRWPPTVAPSAPNGGMPSRTTAMSVVVPPMSAITASSASARWAAPTRLAAGPERIVSTGRSFTKSTDTSEPLPRTIIIGASIPRSARLPPVVATRSSIMAMRRALSRAVTPRFGPPRLADSTWLQVTGFPVRSRMSSRAASSCSALRVANWAVTAKPSTWSATSSTRAASSSRSSGSTGSPWLL